MKKLLLLVSLSVMMFAVPAMAQGERSSSIVSIEGQNYYVHTVDARETVYSLARLYSVSEEDIVGNNPHVAALGLQQGHVLKIPVVDNRKTLSRRQQNRLFDQHIVNHGETAYSISRRYGISVPILVEDNEGLYPDLLEVGQVLNIRRKSIGEQNVEQVDESWQEYKDALNSVTFDYVYHLVEKGETLYSLSRLYSVSQDDIRANNDVGNGLRSGTMIRIPLKKRREEIGTPAQPSTGERPPIITRDTSYTIRTEPGAFNIRIHQPAGTFADSIPVYGTGENTLLNTPPKGDVINVAMFLPLKPGEAANRNFMEFYEGALLALQDVKEAGVSVDMDVYNTNRSVYEVREIVERPDFEKTNLIIGPVYEECMGPAVSFGEKMGVPVVSPLSSLEKESSSVLFQMSPAEDTRYDKLKEVLAGDKNVVVISTANDDKEFDAELRNGVLPSTAGRLQYSKSVPASRIESLLKRDRENIFIVLSQKENEVDEILARISSVQNNLVARGIRGFSVRVVGHTRWQRFVNLDKNLFFKLRLTVVSSYHADRSNDRVLAFDKRYLSSYGATPSLYSYRGYDAAKLFISAMAGVQGSDGFANAVNSSEAILLQMPYCFVQQRRGTSFINDRWALVEYSDDYNIEVK